MTGQPPQLQVGPPPSDLVVVDSPPGGLEEGRSQVVGLGEGRSLVVEQGIPGKGVGTDPPGVEDMLVVTSQYTIRSENSIVDDENESMEQV